MSKSYPGWRKNISTNQIILLCSYGENLSGLSGLKFFAVTKETMNVFLLSEKVVVICCVHMGQK
jgi:hypothetical protein